MVAVKLPNIMSGSVIFESVLSIKVLEWLIILGSLIAIMSKNLVQLERC